MEVCIKFGRLYDTELPLLSSLFNGDFNNILSCTAADSSGTKKTADSGMQISFCLMALTLGTLETSCVTQDNDPGLWAIMFDGIISG